MTDFEYDVLDELYFLQSYRYLSKALDLSDAQLKETLLVLLEKGWIKCYSTPTDEIEFDRSGYERDYWNYHYLATKPGLLAHNGNF